MELSKEQAERLRDALYCLESIYGLATEDEQLLTSILHFVQQPSEQLTKQSMLK